MTDLPIEQVRQLSQWLQDTDITLLELSGPGRLVRLRRDAAGTVAEQAAPVAPAAPASAPAPAPAARVVRAGSVGVLLHTHPLRADPLVRVAQEVVEGQVLALLKIGLVLLPVRAPCTGTVGRILAAHESTVGFGDALFELS